VFICGICGSSSRQVSLTYGTTVNMI